MISESMCGLGSRLVDSGDHRSFDCKKAHLRGKLAFAMLPALTSSAEALFRAISRDHSGSWDSVLDKGGLQMKHSTKSAPRYRPPTASDFQRIRRMWTKTDDGKRPARGSEAQLLSRFFYSSIWNSLLRLDALEAPSTAPSPRSLRQFKAAKKKIRQHIKFGGEVGKYLARQKLANDHR